MQKNYNPDFDSPADAKIALCMAGQMRTYKKCYGELKENILEPLEPDVFIHTEKNRGITKRASNQALDEAVESSITEESLTCLYDPKEMEITEPFSAEDLREFDNVRVPDTLIEAEPDHWQGNIPNFHGIYKCNGMKRNWEQRHGFKYDIVIRMRPDLFVPQNLPSEVLSNPDILWHTQTTNSQVSDKFAISNSENMDYYASVWEQLAQYWEEPLGDGDWVNHRVGERLLNYHMDQSDIETRQFDIGSYALRSRAYIRDEIREEMRLWNRYVPKKMKIAVNDPRRAITYPVRLLRRNLV